MTDLLRLYDPDEVSFGGYPRPWNDKTIPNLVREQAGHRCIRCGHPYRKGEHGNGEWSPCDRRCSHRGPARLSYAAEDGSLVEDLGHELATEAGVVVGYGKRVEARYRILTVHHLDGNKLDCRWWNLTALCQRCHLTVQGKVVMQRRWLHEHSAWFRPYVAAFYAFDRLGEELTREETEARLDELLELEARQLALVTETGRDASTERTP